MTRKQIGIVAAFGLIVLGARLLLISNYATYVPYWDDWIIGLKLHNYHNYGFDVENTLFATNNQHRWVFTKLLNIVLFELNHHQWDPFVPMVFNSFIWLATGALLLHIGYRNSHTINSTTFAVFVFILWIFPLSLFNILSTIQSLNYFMIWFVLLGCYLLTSKALTIRWFAGLLSIAAAGLCYAGGILAPIIIAIVSFTLAAFASTERRQHLITGMATAVVSVASIHHIFTHLLSSGRVKSTSIDAFLTSLAKNLSWPLSEHTWPFLIMLTPLLLFTIVVLISSTKNHRLSSFTLFIGGFSVAIAVSIAQSRGINGAGPANRYYEFMSIYLIANLLALLQLNNLKPRFYPKQLIAALSIAWIAVIVGSIEHHINGIRFILKEQQALTPVQESVVSAFAYTRDEAVFLNRKNREVPFNQPTVLAQMISDLEDDDMLPYQFQLRNMKTRDDNQVFIKNGLGATVAGAYRHREPVLGSFNPARGSQNNTGKYISEIFSADRPYVMVPTLGHLGFPNTSLKLVGKNNRDEKILPATLNLSSEHIWQHTIVPAPDSEYSIHASDNSPQLWFAYAAPRSVGRLSYYVYRMFGYGKVILFAGVLLLLFLLRESIFRAFKTTNR